MSIASRLTTLSARLSRYVRRCGILGGVSNFGRTVFGSGLVRLVIPGSQDGVFVRAHTTDVAAFEQVFIDGEYDIPGIRQEPGFILDAGANIGCASIFFARRYPSATIWAIEPERSNFAILSENAATRKRIVPVEGAVWKTDGEVAIVNPTDDKWAFRVQSNCGGNRTTVKAFSIPSIMEMAGVEHIDILKLDIEGAEKEILEFSSTRWMHRVSTIIIELHDWLKPGCSEALDQAAKDIPFQRSRQGENVVLERL